MPCIKEDNLYLCPTSDMILDVIGKAADRGISAYKVFLKAGISEKDLLNYLSKDNDDVMPLDQWQRLLKVALSEFSANDCVYGEYFPENVD